MNKYKINVAIAGRHFCQINIPETIPEQAIAKAQEIKKIFGAAYEVTMSCWNDIGKDVKI